MATLTPMPWVKEQFFDNDGNPADGYRLWTYVTGTSTHQATWSNADGSTLNSNPVILDSAGRASVFIGDDVYKFVLASPTDLTDPPTSPIWSEDGVRAVAPVEGNVDIARATAGETVTAGQWVYLSEGGGGGISGRWYLTDSTNNYSSTLAKGIAIALETITTGTSGSIRVSGIFTTSGLTAGAAYYLTTTPGAVSTLPNGSFTRVVGVANRTTEMLLTDYTRTVTATDALPGLVSLEAQTLGAGRKALLPDFTGLPTGIGAFVTAYAPGDITKNNSTAFTDVTGVSFAVLASTNYVFMIIVHGVSAIAAGFKFTLTGPAAPTAVRYGVEFPTGAGSVTAFGSNIVRTSSGSNESIMIMGQLRNGANAGTVQLQFAQSAADVSDSKVFAETCVMAWRVS